MSEVIDIKLLKLENTGEFWAKEIKSSHMSKEGAEFEKLTKEINDHFNSDDLVFGRILNPYQGQICIGRNRTNNTWYRVRIKCVVQSSRGRMATCFLLDHAETCHIDVLSLREADQMFLKIPYQAKKFVLHGIQPVTMVTDWESRSTSLKPAKAWDISSTEYVEELYKRALQMQAELMLRDDWGRIHVRLYITLKGKGRMCVNKDLVEKDYATDGVPLSDDCMPRVAEEKIHEIQQSPLCSDNSQQEYKSKDKEKKAFHRDLPSSSDESYSSDKHTALYRDLDDVQVTFKPAGKPNLRSAKPKIPSTNSERNSDKANSADVQGSPRALVPTQYSQMEGSQTQPPSPQKPAGRASFMMSLVSREKKPGHSPPKSLHDSESPRQQTAVSVVNQSPMGAHTSRGRGQQVQAMTSHLESSPTEQNGIPDLESMSPVKKRQNTVGRGQQLLNLLPSIALEAKVPGLSQEHSQPKSDSASATDSSPAMQNIRRSSDRLSYLSDSQEEGESSPKRPRTPNNVRFSDADEILLPRQDSTPPSSDIQPPRSILKKSPSSDHDISMEYFSENSPSVRRRTDWTSGEESACEVSTSDKFRPSITRAATDLLYKLKTGSLLEERPHHGQDIVTPDSENVLYMGPTKPKAILSVEEVPFGELIKKALIHQPSSRTTRLACFAWTPIQRGFDVASVCATGDWTLHTYVFPLVYQLQQAENYKDLPKGFGPRVLILASSWKTARVVYDSCNTVVEMANRYSARQIRAKVIFGGGDDSNLGVSLVNGCDILVATPHCLLRMLQAEYTSLNRLCHLVLEEADILTEEFTKQIKDIMEQYQTTFKHQTDRTAPKQLLTFSPRWTPSLTAFTRLYMNSPTIIITRQIEAAIFGRVKMIPVGCKYDDRMDRLLKILDTSLGDHTGKTIIFTSDNEARSLHEMLLCCSHFALLACSGMDDCVLNDVKRRWNNPHNPDTQLILVLTDEVMSEVLYDITDVTTVIHYQSPGIKNVRGTRKWALRTRLWTMRNGFVNPVADRQAVSKCRSYLFLTESLGEESQNLVLLLQRLYIKVPDVLTQRAEFFMKKVKKGEPNELCRLMKAFGKCRDEKKCTSRHIVFSSLDSPGVSTVYQKLPQHGEVKVYITHVHKDGICFYGRLLEHRVNGKTTTLNSSYVNLTVRMNMWFCVPSRRKKCELPQQGKLYAVEDVQHAFHRVETCKLSAIGAGGLSEVALVYFVDIGRTEKIKTGDMYELPDDLAKIQFQAVELFVCRVKPVDYDKEWTGQASSFLSDLVFNKTLDGTILLSMANTLWLDPLVEREHLEQVHVISTKYNVRTELQKNEYGEENNQHLYLLYSACRGRLSLPDEIYNPERSATKAYTVYGKPMEVAVESLTVHSPDPDNVIESWESKFVEVYVSAVSSPDLVYLQLANRQPLWLDVQEDLDTYVRLTDPQTIEEVKKGTLVMAKFPLEEDKWYRGKVMDIKTSQVSGEDSATKERIEVDVFFLDTGEQEWVSKEDIQPLDVRYLQLPFQAIECIIMHLLPKGESWSESVSDFIWDVSRTQDEEPVPKKLYANVVSSGPARHTGSRHYGVELYDTSRMYNINLASHLVARGMADFTSEYKQELFTVPETEDCYSKLATVCQIIAHIDTNNPQLQDGVSQDAANPHLKLCQELMKNITDNTKAGGMESAHNEQLISWLCTLLMFVWEDLVVDTVCTALTILISASEENLETMEKRVDITCEVLDFSQSHVVQKAVLGLWSALMHDANCRLTLLSKGSARILSSILNTSQNPEVIEACLDTMLLLVTSIPSDQGLMRLIGSSGLITAVCKYLSEKSYKDEEGYSQNISVQCVQVLSTLARYTGLRDTLRKQGAVKELCGLLGDPETEVPVLEVCVTTLDRLSSNNRFNKDLMNTYNMISICGRLSRDTDLSKEVCDMCHNLQNRLESVKKSSQNSPPRKTHHSTTETSSYTKGLTSSSKIHIRGLRLTVPQPIVREAKPDIVWAQDKWNLLLRVQVREVSQDQPVACFLPHSLKFEAVQEDTVYKFELSLYELIEPDDCEVGVCAAEVRLGLRKSTKGRWPRLTKEKSKLPYIKVDFDRFIDSSESDTEDVESPQESPLSLVKRNVQRHFSPFGSHVPVDKKVRGAFNPRLLETNSDSEASKSTDEDLPISDDDNDKESYRL